MKTNRLSRRFRTPDSITAMALSPDGQYLAVVGVQKVIRIRNLKTNKEIYRLAGHKERVESLAFSPDGRTLASGGEDKEIRLWEMASGKPCLRITTAAKLTCLAFSRDGRYLASGGQSPDIPLWDLATGDEAATLQGHLKGVNPSIPDFEGTMSGPRVSALAFSPDCKTLASGSWDTTILLWDWRTMLKPKGKPSSRPSASELEHHWNDLASGNAATAYRAIWTLAQSPEAALALIRARVRPVPSPKPGQIAGLIADLDNIDFSTRKQASLELAAFGELAEPELRQALRKKGTLELRRRAKMLLDRVERRILSASDLRNLRALAVLEQIGTRGSMDFLRQLAGGASGARLTSEAQDTLARLRHRK